MTNFLPMAVFAPVDQHYLLQARQMQALSFAVHIPLVCFGISFPVMILYLRQAWVRLEGSGASPEGRVFRGFLGGDGPRPGLPGCVLG
jgi:hypothetical protein